MLTRTEEIIQLASTTALVRREIAERLNIDPSWVSRVLIAAGWPRLSRNGRELSEPKRIRIQELYDAGCNDVEIARQVGAHPKTVHYWRRYRHLPPVDGEMPYNREMAATIEQRLAEGKSYGRIGKELGITRNTVAGHAWRLKQRYMRKEGIR